MKLKIKKKNKALILLYLVCFMFVLSGIKTTGNVKSEKSKIEPSVYYFSDKLYNIPLIVDHDDAQIFSQVADSKNQYRNRFEICEVQLIEPEFETVQGTTGKYEYAGIQLYMDELNDTYAFYDSQILTRSNTTDINNEPFFLNGTLISYENDLETIDGSYDEFSSLQFGADFGGFSMKEFSDGTKNLGGYFNLYDDGVICTAEVQTWIDENDHRKVCYFDIGNGGYCGIEWIEGASTSAGTMEYWFYFPELTTFAAHYKDGASTYLFSIAFWDDGRFSYWKGTTYYIGTYETGWNHLRIDFDCVGGYLGLAHDKVRFFLNGVDIGTYDFRQGGNDLTYYYWFEQDTNKIVGIDAIGHNWQLGIDYEIGMNRIRIPQCLNFTDSIWFTNYTADFIDLDLHYAINTNTTGNTGNFSIWNNDLQNWYTVNCSINSTGFYDSVFSLNSSYINSSKYINYKIEVVNASQYVGILIEMMRIDITRMEYNFTNYHFIQAEFYTYDAVGTYVKWFQFRYNIYKYYLDYTVNMFTWTGSGWIHTAEVIDYVMNGTAIYIDSLELLAQCKTNSTHIEFEIKHILNYNNTLSETVNRVFDSSYGKACSIDFQYERNNPYFRENYEWYNHMNLRGCRLFRCTILGTGQEYSRFFDIPYFNDNIELLDFYPDWTDDDDDYNSPVQTFWYYDFYLIEFYDTETIIIENDILDDLEYDFSYIQGTKTTAKFYYIPVLVDWTDDWEIDIGLGVISLNFIRDIAEWLINSLWIAGQWVLYAMWLCFAYIVSWIGFVVIVPFLWNILFYWFWYWFLYLMCKIIELAWLCIVYIYENWLVPFWIWFLEIGLPWLMDAIVFLVVWIIALFIWFCFTLCQGDLDEIHSTTESAVNQLIDFLMTCIEVFIENYAYIILFVGLYLAIVGMALVKLLVVKARGFTNRIEEMIHMITVYIFPFNVVYWIIIKLKSLLNPQS